jgi:hypothetical protein
VRTGHNTPGVHTVPRYTLSVTEQADLNLHRLASDLGIPEVEVLRHAINTYATIKRRSSDGYVWVKEQRHGKLIITKVAIP